jgi:hypothetical protein
MKPRALSLITSLGSLLVTVSFAPLWRISVCAPVSILATRLAPSYPDLTVEDMGARTAIEPRPHDNPSRAALEIIDLHSDKIV